MDRHRDAHTHTHTRLISLSPGGYNKYNQHLHGGLELLLDATKRAMRDPLFTGQQCVHGKSIAQNIMSGIISYRSKIYQVISV